MSRPCFALSVMLSFLGFSLLAVEKTHGADDVISSSHDPSECIVCPLAHGPSSLCADLLCADYSDYDSDYNEYYFEEDPAPVPPPAADLDAPQGDNDEDYLADFDWYGEDVADDSAASDDAEEAVAAEADVAADLDRFDEAFEDGDEDTAAIVDDLGDEDSYEAVRETDRPTVESETDYDDFEYYSGYESSEDVAAASDESNDSDAEILATEPAEEDAVVAAEGETADAPEDSYYGGYDSYEEFMRAGESAEVSTDNPTSDSERIVYYEGFGSHEEFIRAGDDATKASGKIGYYAGYRSHEEFLQADEGAAVAADEETTDAHPDGSYAGYDSYEEFMEAGEAAAAATDEALADTAEQVDPESAWAGDDYGYYEDYEQYIEQYEFDAPAAAEATEEVEAAVEELSQTGYDDAYDDAMTLEASNVPAAVEESPADASEAIYDEYESFYDAYDELYNFEADEDLSDATPRLGPVIAEFEAAETTSLEELASSVIRSVMQDLGVASSLEPQDGCAWDCEATDWAQPTAGPAVILNAAQGLDSAALALQEAAQLLRRIAAGSELRLGRGPEDEIAR